MKRSIRASETTNNKGSERLLPADCFPNLLKGENKMIIDTVKLLKAIDNWTCDKMEEADKITNDEVAIKTMDRLERRQYELIDFVNRLENIAEEYLQEQQEQDDREIKSYFQTLIKEK